MKDLSSKIARYLELPSRTHQHELPHGSRAQRPFTAYCYRGQWVADLTRENTGAARECYQRMHMCYWPVDYNEALEFLESMLNDQE